jgi:hypothetical protein
VGFSTVQRHHSVPPSPQQNRFERRANRGRNEGVRAVAREILKIERDIRVAAPWIRRDPIALDNWLRVNG